jgi:hypothetical protein
MTLMTGYFIAEDVSSNEYLKSRWRSRVQIRRQARLTRRDRALFAAFMAPSLVAEVAPLVLFWNDHIPIWQMPVMMAAAWAVGWWVTWIIAMPLMKRAD